MCEGSGNMCGGSGNETSSSPLFVYCVAMFSFSVCTWVVPVVTVRLIGIINLVTIPTMNV